MARTRSRKSIFAKLVSGEWMGTMNLTEPQAGSDLSTLRTRAERAGDGTYKITGQKIFITYGDHDLTENIVHLVLARLADAPPGTRGISLFLVPKFLVEADGSIGEANDLRCHSIEHKLGIHASPTCTMVYGDKGGATGFLIGEENRGLACMFTMMNNARLNVAAQGVAIAERATQQALAYALERRQGRAPGAKDQGMSPIAEQPDVQRMLLTMRGLTQAARALCYLTAEAIDRARRAEAPEARAAAFERASLLTPVAKAFSTDIGVEVASLGVQVHGGMGFIEETGAAQHLRDARIAPIYEGTNGIQAIDLVTRKLPLSEGQAVASLVAGMRATAQKLVGINNPAFGQMAARLRDAVEALDRATQYMLGAVRDAPAGSARRRLALSSPLRPCARDGFARRGGACRACAKPATAIAIRRMPAASGLRASSPRISRPAQPASRPRSRRAPLRCMTPPRRSPLEPRGGPSSRRPHRPRRGRVARCRARHRARARRSGRAGDRHRTFLGSRRRDRRAPRNHRGDGARGERARRRGVAVSLRPHGAPRARRPHGLCKARGATARSCRAQRLRRQ